MASTQKQAKGNRIAKAKQSLPKSTPLKVKILSTLVKSHQETNHLSLIMPESQLASQRKLQGKKTLSTWAKWKKCFQDNTLPILQHNRVSGFVK